MDAFVRDLRDIAGQAQAAARGANQFAQRGPAGAPAQVDWHAAVHGMAQAAAVAANRFSQAAAAAAPPPPRPQPPPAARSQPAASSGQPSTPAAAASRAASGTGTASSSSTSPELPSGRELQQALLEWTAPQLKEAVRDCGLDRSALLEKGDFAEALAKHLDANPRKKLERVTGCSICCGFLPTAVFWPLSCGHLPCEQCLGRYLVVEAEKMTRAGKRHDIYCMIPGCGQVIPIRDAVQFYRHLSKLWKNLGERERMLRNGRYRVVECPQPECVGVAYAEPGRRKAMCFVCEHQWEVDASGQEPSEEAGFSHGVRRCPKCKAPIEKDGGCDHMHCSKCGRDFSWRGANYANPDHGSGGQPDPSGHFDHAWHARDHRVNVDCCVQ